MGVMWAGATLCTQLAPLMRCEFTPKASKVDRGNSVTVSAALKNFIANFAVQDANFVKLAKL